MWGVGVSARMTELGLRGLWLVLALGVAGCPEETVSDVGEVYDPAAPMDSGGEVAADDRVEVDGCEAEPWAYLPSDAFRIRVEAPGDGAFVGVVREFLAELGGEELIDAPVVGNAFRVDSLQVEAGDSEDPGALVAVRRDDEVEVSGFGVFAGEHEAVCSRVAPDGFLVTSMPFPPQEGLDPRGPTPLTSTWIARIEGEVVTLRNEIAMRPGHEPLDVEQERDKLSRQMLEWFPNELPELEVTLESNVLTLRLTADNEAEVEALLDLLSKMVPQVRMSVPAGP